MLKTPLLHPEILRIVAAAGHHAKILIADGNYPGSTKRGPRAEMVYLNLAPGIVTVAQVFRALLEVAPIDAVHTMGIPSDDPYAEQGEPPVWATYRAVLASSGSRLSLVPILKWKFYEQVDSADHILTIQTGDEALWANLLLTVGCRTPSTPPSGASA